MSMAICVSLAGVRIITVKCSNDKNSSCKHRHICCYRYNHWSLTCLEQPALCLNCWLAAKSVQRLSSAVSDSSQQLVNFEHTLRTGAETAYTHITWI